MFVSSAGTIAEEIARRLNEVSADNEDAYKGWINLGIRDIGNTVPNAPFLQTSADRTLSSGTRIYSLPADWGKMNTVTYPAGDTTLAYLEPEQFDILQPSASEGGNPTVYTLRGVGNSSPRIEFYPSIAASITLHYDYQKVMTTVSAFSAVPDVPERYFELLVLYGESRGLRRRGLRADAAQVEQEYELLKEKMRQDLLSQTTGMVRIKNGREFAGRGYFSDPIKNIFNTD